MTSYLEQVPPEVLKRITGFLRYTDAVRLSQASKLLHSDSIGASRLQLPHAILSNGVWGGTARKGDIPIKCCSIPVLMTNCLHTVIVSGLYVDQGWGNQKGLVYIIGSRSGNHRIVAVSPVAPHEVTKFSLEIHFDASPDTTSASGSTITDNDEEDETFQLWLSVGGGGGHSLTLRNVLVELVVLDSGGGRFLSKNFDTLEERGALPEESNAFSFRMLQTMAREMLQKVDSGDVTDNMRSFFESNGISTSRASLLTLDQIATSFLVQIGSYATLPDAPPRLPNALSGDDDNVKEVLQQLFGASLAAASAANDDADAVEAAFIMYDSDSADYYSSDEEM